jgi:hypothetical protein
MPVTSCAAHAESGRLLLVIASGAKQSRPWIATARSAPRDDGGNESTGFGISPCRSAHETAPPFRSKRFARSQHGEAEAFGTRRHPALRDVAVSLFHARGDVLLTRISFSFQEIIVVSRFIVLLLPLAVCACAPAATAPTPKQFALMDASKYKTPAERDLATQLAENDCKAKATAASAIVHKTIASEHNANLGVSMRASRESNEMYSATFISCMNKAGFLYKPAA